MEKILTEVFGIWYLIGAAAFSGYMPEQTGQVLHST